MKTLAAVAALIMAVCALQAERSQAAFGLTDVDVEIADSGGLPVTQAGSHPHEFTTSIAINTVTDPGTGHPVPEEELKDLIAELPPGLIGNPSVASTCSTGDFLASDPVGGRPSLCTPDSTIGFAISITGPGNPPDTVEDPVYNLDPVPGAAARFGFRASGVVPVTIAATVSPEPPYRVIARAENVPQINPVLASEVTLWGIPADPVHDVERCGVGSSCPSTLPEQAFLTMPRSCPGTPLGFGFEADSWVNPGTWLPYSDTTPAMEGCEALGFGPDVTAGPTSSQAASPAGFDFEIEVEDPGLLDPEENAESDLKKAVVTLPAGLTANPASADGLQACSPSQLAQETATSDFGAGCPAVSKVASVEVETPLLPKDPVAGSIFLATPDDPTTPQPGAENPFDTLLAGYLVIKSRERGVSLKLAGKIDADPASGRLTASFDQNPQFPFSELKVKFKTGDRAPLATPAACGTYEVASELHPWSGNAAVIEKDAFAITHGPLGGACPTGGFAPALEAGSSTPQAGSFTSFLTRLKRPDADQELRGLELTLPPGLSGKLAGVPYCPEAAIAAAQGRRGKAELASPSCPPASKLGTVQAGAGVGPSPYYVSGSAYLSGPYKGAPLSLAVITPAVAGPFDLGVVVVRAALRVDPRTAQITAVSDPLPRILQGIPLLLRDLRVSIERPQFTLNPTNCEELAITGTALASGATAPLASRFQVGGCKGLPFKPKLAFRLKGGTKRGMNPKLIATLKARPGDANIGRTKVLLPRSAFLDQSHIRTVCTRVQWAQDSCPKGSVYGKAMATSPLLDYPIAGNVYLRSSDNELPDLVADLRGPAHQPIRIELVGRVDSVRGALGNTFDVVPDAPVDRFRLELFGGKRGLVENSRNLCEGTQRAKVVMDAQSGRRLVLRPQVGKQCGGQGKGTGRKGRR